MLLAPALLALSAVLQSGPTPPSVQDLETLVRRAQAAVEDGRDSTERAYWNRRLESDGERARLARATIDRFTYRYDDAIRGYTALTRDAYTSGATRAYATLGLGLAHLQRGRLRDADPLLREAADALRREGADAGLATALLGLALIVERTASVDSALATYQAAVRVAAPDDAWLRTLIRCNELVARVRSAQLEAAAQARRESRAALAAGNGRAAAACLAALAQEQDRRSQRDSAIATFAEVAELQRRTRNHAALAITRQWQGFVLNSHGDVVRARPALLEAVALGRRTEQVTAAAWAELTLADIALTFGDLPAAGRHARSASATFDSTGDRAGLLIARRLEGDAALLNNSLSAARAAYDHVLRDAPAVFPTMAMHARSRLATVARLEGDWMAAERELDLATREALRLDIPGFAREAAYERALLQLARGDFDDAARRLLALDSLVHPRNLAARSDILTRLAEVHLRAGRVAEGEAVLTRAGDFVDELRTALPDRDLRASVVEARYLDWDRDLGFATAIAGLVTAGRVPAAFRLAEQRRARLLLEGLVRRQALADRPATEPISGITDEAVIRPLLPDSTAVLAYLTGLGNEPTTVFVLTKDRLIATLAAPIDDHANGLRRFTGLLAAGVLPATLARELGAAFLDAPTALLPAEIRRLVVIPDGPLHRAPFDAMQLAGDSLVADRYVVTLAPSVSVAAAWWREPPRAPRPRLLAFGDPSGIRIGIRSGDSVPPRLPVAAREARDVARYAERASVFTGAAAREARLRADSLDDVGVMHFATHAEVEEWSLLESALLLAPGEEEDGRLTSEELLELRIRANLVVLSACRSGSGAVRAGEGLTGLTVPVLEAGAASVAATLWPVSDAAVEPMIELFYRELARGATVGDAMNGAKRAARAAGVTPAVWAAFTLTGDPRVHAGLREPGHAANRLALPIAAVGLALAYYGLRTTRRRKMDAR